MYKLLGNSYQGLLTYLQQLEGEASSAEHVCLSTQARSRSSWMPSFAPPNPGVLVNAFIDSVEVASP